MASFALSLLRNFGKALKEAFSLEGVVLFCDVLVYPHHPPLGLHQRFHDLKVEDSAADRLLPLGFGDVWRAGERKLL
jgi:hypothetical protein